MNKFGYYKEIFLLVTRLIITACKIFYMVYLVHKPLLAAGISDDNAQGWKIVCKMSSWPRSKALRAIVKFWGQSFSRGHYTLMYQPAGTWFIFFITLRIISQDEQDCSCRFCGCFCVSLFGIVNQLFNFSVTGFWKKYSFVFHDQLKV